ADRAWPHRAHRQAGRARGENLRRGDLAGLVPVVPESTPPRYQRSEYPALATGKVRFVGEPVALAVAGSRARAEGILEEVELEIEELPPLVEAEAARAETKTRVHEDWPDNVFLTLAFESGFEAKAKAAEVVVRKEVRLARQAMVPLEGKAVLAT